jgi:hypothetical protein
VQFPSIPDFSFANLCGPLCSTVDLEVEVEKSPVSMESSIFDVQFYPNKPFADLVEHQQQSWVWDGTVWLKIIDPKN